MRQKRNYANGEGDNDILNELTPINLPIDPPKQTNWYDSIFNNLGGILSGGSSLVGAFTGKGSPTSPHTVVYQVKEEKNNTGLYLTIGGALILVVVLIFVFKK